MIQFHQRSRNGAGDPEMAASKRSSVEDERPEVPLLELRNVTTRFTTTAGEFNAVEDVSLAVRSGRTVGIVGESGSGKSVLVRTVMGLLAPNGTIADESEIRYQGQNVHDLDPAQARHFWGPEIAMVFQNPMTSLNPVKRIGAQIAETVKYHGRCSRAVARRRSIELLGEVGLPDPARRFEQYPHELSGGMRQRVMIAIALSCEPKLLIADEPTTALDVTVQQQILDLLDRLQEDHGLTMILISHDLGVVAAHTDDVVIMYAGRVVERASTARIFEGVRHPYTQALLGSIPKIADGRNATLTPIPGLPPSIIDRSRGCSFAPRCRYAQQRCVEESPTLMPPGGEHPAACFFPVGSPEGATALQKNLQAGATATGVPIDMPHVVSA